MSTQDRVSAAAQATASSVREIRPLTLPDDSPVPAGQRARRGRLSRIGEIWIIPLGAAAVVAALALVLVSLQHAQGPRPAPAQTPASGVPAVVSGIPRYYAIANQGSVSHIGQNAAIDVIIGDAYTGKTLTTVALPAKDVTVGMNAAVGVSAADDDRTFVVGRRDENGDVDFFSVHFTPGPKQAATFGHLPVPGTKVGLLLGFAVSPDGQQLAVMYLRGNGTTLAIYSVKSGAVLRTWTAATWTTQTYGLLQTSVSWTGDSRQVAFSTQVPTATNDADNSLVERTIGATAASGDLAAASKVVFNAPGNCSSLLLTPDGGTVVCGTMANYVFPSSPGGCGASLPEFVAYSAATGQRLRVLHGYTGACYAGVDTVLWTDAAARHVIGESDVTTTRNPLRSTDQYGVAVNGNFAPFKVARHGQWYSGPAF